MQNHVLLVGQNRFPDLLQLTLRQLAVLRQANICHRVLLGQWADEAPDLYRPLIDSWPFLELIRVMPTRELLGDRGNYLKQSHMFRSLLAVLGSDDCMIVRLRVDGYISAVPAFADLVSEALERCADSTMTWVGHIRSELGVPYFIEDRYLITSRMTAWSLATYEYARGFVTGCFPEAEFAEFRLFAPSMSRDLVLEIGQQVDWMSLLSHLSGRNWPRVRGFREIAAENQFWNVLFTSYLDTVRQHLLVGVSPSLETRLRLEVEQIEGLESHPWKGDYLPVRTSTPLLPSWMRLERESRERTDFPDVQLVALLNQCFDLAPRVHFVREASAVSFVFEVLKSDQAAAVSAVAIPQPVVWPDTVWIDALILIDRRSVASISGLKFSWYEVCGRPIWTAFPWLELEPDWVITKSFPVTTPPARGMYRLRLELLGERNDYGPTSLLASKDLLISYT